MQGFRRNGHFPDLGIQTSRVPRHNPKLEPQLLRTLDVMAAHVLHKTAAQAELSLGLGEVALAGCPRHLTILVRLLGLGRAGRGEKP